MASSQVFVRFRSLSECSHFCTDLLHNPSTSMPQFLIQFCSCVSVDFLSSAKSSVMCFPLCCFLQLNLNQSVIVRGLSIMWFFITFTSTYPLLKLQRFITPRAFCPTMVTKTVTFVVIDPVSFQLLLPVSNYSICPISVVAMILYIVAIL